jgi:hypothetical protein
MKHFNLTEDAIVDAAMKSIMRKGYFFYFPPSFTTVTDPFFIIGFVPERGAA